MKPRRSTMGSPLAALHIDYAAQVLRVSTQGGGEPRTCTPSLLGNVYQKFEAAKVY